MPDKNNPSPSTESSTAESSTKRMEQKPLIQQVKNKILDTLFSPAPKQEQEPKLLLDEDTCTHHDASAASLSKISSTEASIQELNTTPIPNDDGPRMIFEPETG